MCKYADMQMCKCNEYYSLTNLHICISTHLHINMRSAQGIATPQVPHYFPL